MAAARKPGKAGAKPPAKPKAAEPPAEPPAPQPEPTVEPVAPEPPPASEPEPGPKAAMARIMPMREFPFPWRNVLLTFRPHTPVEVEADLLEALQGADAPIRLEK